MATGSEQPLPPSPPVVAPAPYTYPPIIIILTIVLLIFFFVGFFSIYFCRCFMQNLLCTWHHRNTPTATPVGGTTTTAPTNGVDPSIVQSFPSFTYSTVKDYRKEKYGLECAICLLEFKGSDVLRLLTKCCHVFHQECIDLWLESHKTCPVCRRNLTTPGLQSPVKSPVHENAIDDHEDDHTFTTITIKDENENVSKKGEGVSSCDHHSDEQSELEKFSRSHSTGHSILRNRDDEEKEDRFKLRLPEHVKSRIIKGHNSSKSWSTFGEYKAKDDATSLAEVTGESGGDDKV